MWRHGSILYKTPGCPQLFVVPAIPSIVDPPGIPIPEESILTLS
ncbi:Uncharacterised protein [Brucella abortus]|nr:Uncharacterised protein [Brucella abortus]